MFRRVPVTMLSDGLILASAIHDENLRLLLGAGIPITADLISGLIGRNVQTVVVAEKDWVRLSAFKAAGKSSKALAARLGATSSLETAAGRELDVVAAGFGSCEIVASANPFVAQMQSPGAVRYEPAAMDRVVERHHETVDHVRNLLETLDDNGIVAADAVAEVTTDALVRAAEDLDLFVCMGINPGTDSSVFAHSTNVATLAVAIGAKLGLDVDALRDLGTGCLVQNAGMLKIDPNVYESPHVLTDIEFLEIAKHPVISTDQLYKNMKGVPLGVRMIVYQMHERCDGSGYPRGITGDKIHPLAKIAAVADAYVALVSPRPHRPAMLPYHAIVKMLADVKAGLYDSKVVRALLHTVSLFPIGSFVELNNSLVGKTIRANGDRYDRPILEVWNRTHLTAAPRLVDLAEQTDLKVVKPLTYLH